MPLKLLNTNCLAACAQAALDPVFQDVHRNNHVLLYINCLLVLPSHRGNRLHFFAWHALVCMELQPGYIGVHS